MSKLSIWKEAEIYRNDSAGVQVYKGLLQGSNTPVAIKEQTFASLSQANQGLQEAHSAMRLSHSGIMHIFDCAIENTVEGLFRTVLISELMAEDLYKALKRREREQNYWSEPQLMGILAQVIAALSYAEKMGVCHRDIKPQNLFTNEDQTVVKVGDFGTAATVNVFGERKSTLVGSPFFLSPELKRSFSAASSGPGSTHSTYDPYKSDVYSLGVTFLYMATLRAPVGLMEMDNLAVKTEEALGNVAGYGVLQWYLRWMLAVEEQNRPYFQQLEESFVQYGYIPSAAQPYSTLQIVHQEAPEPQSVPMPLALCQGCGQSNLSPSSPYCAVCQQAMKAYYQHEEVKTHLVDPSCLGCPASLKKPSNARVTLPCGHRFHDRNCFFTYLKHTNMEFQGPHVDIACPRCPNIPIDYKKELLACAFGSFEAFVKRRNESRKEYCTVCHSQEKLEYRQECGHRYCPAHMPPKGCENCKYCLPEWRDV